MKRVRKCVFPVAGMGSRFLPATKASPKEMMPVVDKPLIQYAVEEAVAAGITDMIFITGRNKRTIEDHFDATNLDLIENLKMGGEKKEHLLKEVEKISKMANFIYVRQKGPYGNGTPLINVKHIVGDEPFIYTFSDDFIVSKPSRFRQMLAVYEEYGSSVLGSVKVTKDEDYRRYGFAGGEELRDGIIDVKTVVEKPGKENSPSDLANVSGYLFTPDIFDYLDQVLSQLKEGEEFYYNDALKLMLADKKRVIAAEIKGGKYYDTGNKIEYMKTAVELALEHPEIKDDFRSFLKDLKL